MTLHLLLACAARVVTPDPPVSAGPSASDAPVTTPASAAGQESAMPDDLDALLDFGDPAGSEAAYRALLPAALDRGMEDALSLETRIARTLGLQGRFDEAHALLDEVEAGLSELPHGAAAEARVRLALERGRVINSGGDPPASAALFEEALTLADDAGLEGLAVDAAHMLGIVLPPHDALAWNLRAIERAEASSDPAARRWLGPLYNNTGWTFMDQDQPDKALVLFEKGVAFREAAGKPGPLRIARYTVARAWRALGRCEEALPLLESLRAEWARAGSPDGYVFEELGECLWALDRREEARPHLAEAWRILSQDSWLAEHEAARLASLAERGAVDDAPG